MTILKIDASARTSTSNSRALTSYLVDALAEPVRSRDLGQQPLPAISAEDLIALHGASEQQWPSLQAHRQLSNQLIAELMAADTLVFGLPIYNFGVPVVLKQWIDYICRTGLTFKYSEQGPVGLTSVKRAFIVSASGGVAIGSEMEFASRYLEHICHFIGVEQVIHIDASGSKGAAEQIIASGKQQIDQALAAVAAEPVEEVV